MQRTSWGVVAAAVATVLACVAVQVVRDTSAGGIGEAAYGRDVERLMAEGSWEDVIHVCQRELQKHPLERRAHFYLSRGLAETGLPEPALMHLVCSAVPRSANAGPSLLPAPSKSEIDEQLARLDERFPDAMNHTWAQWRKERLGAVIADAQAWADVLARLGAITHVSWQEAPGSAEASLHADVAVPALSLTVGGEFAGTCCLLRVGETEYRREPTGGWLFLAVEPRTGRVLDEKRLGFAPLTGDVDLFAAWLNELPDDVLLVACAPGEAVNAMAPEARGALMELVGVTRIPAQDSLLAYAFVAFRSAGGMRVVEAVAAAPDVPVGMRIE